MKFLSQKDVFDWVGGYDNFIVDEFPMPCQDFYDIEFTSLELCGRDVGGILNSKVKLFRDRNAELMLWIVSSSLLPLEACDKELDEFRKKHRMELDLSKFPGVVFCRKDRFCLDYINLLYRAFNDFIIISKGAGELIYFSHDEWIEEYSRK